MLRPVTFMDNSFMFKNRFKRLTIRFTG
jgi:hypothetical protein